MPASTFFGLPSLRGHLALVVALGVDAVGSGCSGPLLLLFLTRVAHQSVGTAGALLSAAGLVSLLVPAVVGAVIDRVGARTVVIVAQLIQAAAMTGYLFARTFPLLLCCAMAAAFGMRAFWSSVFALVAAAGDSGPAEDRDRWFALSGMVQGAGFVLGGLLAGVLLAFHGAGPYLVALSLNAASFVLCAALLTLEPAPGPKPGKAGAVRNSPLRDRPYVALIGVNTLFALCSVMLGIGLPLYIVEGLHEHGWTVGPLLAVNTLLGATCQGVAVRKTGRFSRTRILVVAGILWAVWAAATAAMTITPEALVIPGLALCVLAYAAAELIHAPTSMALASEAAPAEVRAGYLSYFQYSFAIAMVIAPGAFAALFGISRTLPWISIAIVALAAAVGMLLTERHLPAAALRKESPQEPERQFAGERPKARLKARLNASSEE